MKSVLTLLVEDSKVLPILRAIEHIGVQQLDIKPVKEGLKALPAPIEAPPKRPGHAKKILAVLRAQSEPMIRSQLVNITGLDPKLISNSLTYLRKTKQVKKTHQGWRANGS